MSDPPSVLQYLLEFAQTHVQKGGWGTLGAQRLPGEPGTRSTPGATQRPREELQAIKENSTRNKLVTAKE